MSLINKMLQDLDARKSDASQGSSLGAVIRAVPPRRNTHPALWACVALAGVSVGMSGWLLLRPAPAPVPLAPAAASAAPPAEQLSLRFETRLPSVEAAQPVAPANLEGQPATTANAQPAALVAPATATEAVPAAVPATPVPPAAAPVKSAPAAAPAPASAVPQEARPAPPAAQRSERRSSATADVAEPLVTLAGAKQVREQTPAQRAENDYRKALALLQQGRPAEASPVLEQVLQLNVRHAGARQALIGILLDGGRRDDALRLAKEGLALDVSSSALAMITARIQLERGELQPAIDTLERSLPHGAGQADYLAFLAALQQRAGRHRESADLYVQALQKSPQNGVWWMGLGISLQADQRKAEAVEAYGRARASASLSPDLQDFVESRLAQLR